MGVATSWNWFGYIHLNPVRARIVRRPDAYRWTSHREYLRGKGPEWLTMDTVLGHFSPQRVRAIARYRDFVNDGIGGTVTLDFQRGNVKGKDALAEGGFLSQVNRRGEERTQWRVTLAEAEARVCKALKIEPADLWRRGREPRAATGRALLAHLSRRYGNWTMAEIVRKSGRESATVSQAANRFGERLEQNPATRKLLREVTGRAG
jgi:hypothetical protein